MFTCEACNSSFKGKNAEHIHPISCSKWTAFHDNTPHPAIAVLAQCSVGEECPYCKCSLPKDRSAMIIHIVKRTCDKLDNVRGRRVVTAPVVTAPVVTAPVVTAPVVTAPVVTAPVVTAPVVTAPVVEGITVLPTEEARLKLQLDIYRRQIDTLLSQKFSYEEEIEGLKRVTYSAQTRTNRLLKELRELKSLKNNVAPIVSERFLLEYTTSYEKKWGDGIKMAEVIAMSKPTIITEKLDRMGIKSCESNFFGDVSESSDESEEEISEAVMAKGLVRGALMTEKDRLEVIRRYDLPSNAVFNTVDEALLLLDVT